MISFTEIVHVNSLVLSLTDCSLTLIQMDQMEENYHNLYSITNFIMEGMETNQHSIENILEKQNKNSQKEAMTIKKSCSLGFTTCFQNSIENFNQNESIKEESINTGRNRKKNVLIKKSNAKSSKNFIWDNKQEIVKKSIPNIYEVNRRLSAIHRYILKDHSAIVNKAYLTRLYSGVEYALQRLKHPSVSFIQNNSKLLKQEENSNKKFLFLDLDQTLIKTKQVQTPQKAGNSYRLLIRPYTFTFLEELSQYYEIYVFTAATKSYAQGVINRLNRDKPIIKDKLCRQNCSLTKRGHCIKDLRIVKNRQLKDIVIIDNTVQAFGFNLNNGIPILDFYGQEGDKELLKLIPFLKSLSQVDDVRPIIKKKFNLPGLLDIKKTDLDFYFESIWN